MYSQSTTRRAFLASLGTGAAALGLGGAVKTGHSQGRPNVLFMCVDDLNDWVGCLGGHPDVKTPNLDRLAARGVLFTRAYCAAPACCPSRTAVMTGVMPSTSGVYHNSQFFRDSEVLGDAVTLPQHFRAHGYRAAGSGKIYHGIFPDPPSWDDYWPSQAMTRPPDPMPENRPLNGIPDTSHFDWGPVDATDAEMGDMQVAEWAAGQLGRRHEKPFFIGCGFYKPHLPWYVPKKYFDMYPPEEITLPTVKEDDLDDVPELGRRMANPGRDHATVLKYGQWRKAVQGYLASITFADECVGKVIDALDAGPNRDDTIVVLWSDHGWHLGEKLHWRKFALWEEATRNVLMVVAPGVTEPGGVCRATVNLLDIYPTLVDLCGLEKKSGLEGESLVPYLEDPSLPSRRPSLTTRGRNNHSLRSDRWRYIRYSDGTEELYDHDADELEWHNLAGKPEYADIKRGLAGRLPKVNVENSPAEDRESQLRRMREMGIQLP